jgi:hypothetical protein
LARSDAELYHRPYVLLDLMLGLIPGYTLTAHLCSGDDLYTAMVKTYNPMYAVVEGGTNLANDIQHGSSGFQVAMDTLELASGVVGTLAIAGGGVGIARSLGPAKGAVRLSPSAVRFSQSSVNGAANIVGSMKKDGWVGASIEVVRMSDGALTTVDNSRLLAAHLSGIRVKATIHSFDDPLPEGFVDRFTTLRGGAPSTWGRAIQNRIDSQSVGYRAAYPFGSSFTGWDGN